MTWPWSGVSLGSGRGAGLAGHLGATDLSVAYSTILGTMNRPLAWAGALRRASSWLIDGRTLIRPGHIDQREGVGSRLDPADIHFFQLLNVTEDIS